jgi:phage-related protein
MDPMKALQGAFNRINTGIQAVSDFVFNFAALIENGANLRDVVLSNLGAVRENVAGFLGDLLGSAAEGIGRVLTGAANFMQQAPIGELLASIFNGIIEAIDEVDWRDISTQIGRIVNGLIVQLVKFVSTLDYGALLNSALSLLSELASGLFKGLLEGVNIQLPRISISDLPTLAGKLVAAIINQVTRLVANLDMASLMASLVEFTFNLFDLLYQALSSINWISLIMNGLPMLIFGVLVPLFQFLAAAAVNINWGQLLQASLIIVGLVPAMITGLFIRLTEEIRSRIPSLITAVENFLVNARSSIIGAFRQLFNEVKNKVLEIIPGLGGVARPIGSAIGSALSNIPGAAAFSRAGGQLPVAFGGLLGAIRQEQSSAPPGAKPVIANSSEFILRPDQARVFAAGAAMGGGGQTNYNFNPTINLGAGTAEAHAMDVLRYFEIWLSEHQQASLA